MRKTGRGVEQEFVAEVDELVCIQLAVKMSYLNKPVAVTAEIMFTDNRAPVVRAMGCVPRRPGGAGVVVERTAASSAK